MTQPDEATMPDAPEKAHGDALDEIVEDRPDDGAAQDGAAQPVADAGA